MSKTGLRSRNSPWRPKPLSNRIHRVKPSWQPKPQDPNQEAAETPAAGTETLSTEMDRALCLFRSPHNSKPRPDFQLYPSYFRSENLSFCPRSEPAQPRPSLAFCSSPRTLGSSSPPLSSHLPSVLSIKNRTFGTGLRILTIFTRFSISLAF